MTSLIWGILKKNDTNELIYKSERLTENELMVANGEEWSEGREWEFDTMMYTLLYLKWLTIKVLLYSKRELCSV